MLQSGCNGPSTYQFAARSNCLLAQAGQPITFKIKDQQGAFVHFKVKPTATFKKVRSVVLASCWFKELEQEVCAHIDTLEEPESDVTCCACQVA